MVSLRNGVDPSVAVRLLVDATREAGNVLGAGGSAVDLMARYLRWTAAQERMFEGSFSRLDIERLLTTRRYWAIQATDSASTPFLAAFVTLELNARIEDFNHEIDVLERNAAIWNVPAAESTFAEHLHAVVVDTNVLMRHGGGVRDLDLANIAGTHPAQSVAITVPAVVVEELDRLKHANGKMTFDGVAHERRWLATLALGWLDRTFPGQDRRVPLRRSSASADLAPAVYAVLMSDDPGRTPLSKADSEIIDSALRVGQFAKTVTLASYDSHMIFAARHIGLRAHKLAETPDSKEDPGDTGANLGSEPIPSIGAAIDPVGELTGDELWLTTEGSDSPDA
jgi:hypothetical protein